MVSFRVFYGALVVEGSLITGAIVLLGGHGMWVWWYAKWSRPVLDMARTVLLDALQDRLASKRASVLLDPLPMGLKIQLITGLSKNLYGDQRQSLAAIASDIGIRSAAVSSCGSRFWWRRLRGARLVTLLGGEEEMMFQLFLDRNPMVRAQAAEWASQHPSLAAASKLVAMLSDSSGHCRFAAQDTLQRIGAVGVESILEHLSIHSGTSAAAALAVAVGLRDPRLLDPALRFGRDGSARVRSLAATVIGTLGGEDAVSLLTELLNDADAEVRAAAARSLGKLGYWPSAVSLSLLLSDDVWETRRDAALALQSLDSPGVLILQRAASSGDPRASNIARQVLDLPDDLEATSSARA